MYTLVFIKTNPISYQLLIYFQILYCVTYIRFSIVPTNRE